MKPDRKDTNSPKAADKPAPYQSKEKPKPKKGWFSRLIHSEPGVCTIWGFTALRRSGPRLSELSNTKAQILEEALKKAKPNKSNVAAITLSDHVPRRKVSSSANT